MDIIKSLQTGEKIQIFKVDEVAALIDQGLARPVNIHLPGRKMVPEGHVAIHLTLKGRAHGNEATVTTPAGDDGQDVPKRKKSDGDTDSDSGSTDTTGAS